MTKATISNEAFRLALSETKQRKSGAKFEIRIAIINMVEGEVLDCNIHYQSYKDLQRALLHEGLAYILKAEVDGKNVTKLLVSKDLDIILEGQAAFQSDKKYQKLDTPKVAEVVEV